MDNCYKMLQRPATVFVFFFSCQLIEKLVNWFTSKNLEAGMVNARKELASLRAKVEVFFFFFFQNVENRITMQVEHSKTK